MIIKSNNFKNIENLCRDVSFCFKRKTIIYLSIISLEFQLQLSYGIIIIKYSSTLINFAPAISKLKDSTP